MTRIVVALFLSLAFSAASVAVAPVPASAEDAPRGVRTVEIGVPDMH